MRIFIILQLVAVGVGSLVAFNALVNHDLDTRVQQNANDTSRQIERYVKRSQGELLRMVDLVGTVPTFRSVFGIPRADGTTIQPTNDTYFSSTIGSNLDRYCPKLGVESIGFMASDGKILVSSPKWPADMPDLLTLPGVTDVFSGKPWQGLSSEGGRLHSIVIAPIQLSQQGLNGALVGVSSISESEAQMLRYNDASEVVFLDGTKVLASSRKFDSPLLADPAAIQFVKSGDKEFMGVYRQLPNTQSGRPIGFVALEDYGVITAFSRSAGTAFALILLVITAVGLVLGERFTKGLVQPLDELVKSAEGMRSGQTPTPLEVGNRKDEVAVLQTVFNDMVAAVAEKENMLLGMIDTDPLTGVGNHRFLHERLRHLVTRAKESGQALSLILIDLDHFHEFNIAKGHSEGDQQLRAYAGLLRGICPGTTVLARYSGDQFVALLPNQMSAEANRVAVDLKKAASQDRNLVPVSIGIAAFDPNTPNEEALLLASELALSRAKQLGRNRISIFERELEGDSSGSAQVLQRFLTDGSLATVQALAAAVDAKDQYTKGHSERVANFARDLAVYMKCSPSFVELVYCAGTLHDVGKIGVPDAILTKPQKLLPEEISVMETHPVLGEVIVAKVPQLAPLIPGVRHHHERWDGKGYPDGKAGEQIPTLARYLAVADTFDAMTSDRPYRKALSVEIALIEIERCAGTQFQKELALAFVKMFREQMEIRVSA